MLVSPQMNLFIRCVQRTPKSESLDLIEMIEQSLEPFCDVTIVSE